VIGCFSLPIFFFFWAVRQLAGWGSVEHTVLLYNISYCVSCSFFLLCKQLMELLQILFSKNYRAEEEKENRK
jgi:hypothetical protein